MRDITNMNEKQKCIYSKEFPVDEYGRPGGMLSLVDLPIAKYDTLSRPGYIKGESENKYLVEDADERWRFWIPKEEVRTGVEDENN